MMNKSDNPIRIALINYSTAQQSTVYGVQDMFSVARRLCPDSDIPDLVITSPDDSYRYPVIIIPSCLEKLMPPEEEKNTLIKWIQDQHKEGARICSVCGGAFLLASSGLLDNRPATTHWALKEVFTERYPDILVDTDQILIDDGDIVTAGGVTAWMDLALKLLQQYAGPSAATKTAHYFLVDSGAREQRFYSCFVPVLSHGDQKILHVQHWLQANYKNTIRISDMATEASLEERTLIRRFSQATGLPPASYLQKLRIGKAQEMLESTRKTADVISWECGYEDASAFRRAFRKITGQTPGEYRKRFGQLRITA